jgi:MYXO-CTERM domain-containing protein
MSNRQKVAGGRGALLLPVLALAALLLGLDWLYGVAPVRAHSPHPGLDFAIGVDTTGDTVDDCGTNVGQPAKCSVSTGGTFRLNVYLNSLGGIPSYEGFDIYVEYSGVSSNSNPDASSWPDCVFQANDTSLPGVVVWGCAIGVAPAGPSTYTGLIGTLDFNCTANGSITLLHSIFPGTDLVENVSPEGQHAEGQLTTEALTVNCVPPAVGGLSLDPASSASPLESARSTTDSGALLGSTVIGIAAAGMLALGGAAWYRRRRRLLRR